MSTNDDDGIYRVDTVPPPAGEADAYNAPTRVGPMAGAIVEELVAQARREAEQQSGKNGTPAQVELKPEEPVAIDPAALLNVESLTAQLDAARSSAEAKSEGSKTSKSDSTPPIVSGEPITAAVVMSASEPATPAPRSVPVSTAAKPAPSSSTSTWVLLALLVALAAMGLYLLLLRR